MKLAQVIAANHKAANINFDWIEPARQLRIGNINQDEARLLGLSSQAVASVLNTVITGQSVTQVRDDIYLVDVIARATDEQRVSLAALRALQVPLPGGRTVPLSQFATFEYEQDYPLIWRRDRVPTLTVQADVVPGTLPETVVNSLKPAIDALAGGLTAPYSIAVGGTVEESSKSQASVIAVVPAMLLIMLTVLMLQLRSFQRLFIVLQRRSTRLDRRRRRAVAIRPAPRLRRHTRYPGVVRHDHKERRHSHWADRGRTHAREGCSASRNRRQ